MAEKPEIVVLCGSSRFCDRIAVEAWELEKRGKIVLSMHLLPSWYCPVKDHFAEHQGVAAQMDELHLRKIDLADRVVVMNFEGYIGDRTKAEIQYAQMVGKPVDYIHPPIGLLETHQAPTKHDGGFEHPNRH